MPAKYVDAICSYCGVTFPRLADKMKAKQQFCSKEHQALGQTYVPGEAYSKSGPYRGVHVCPVCSSEFRPHHPAVIYCSDSCKYKRRNERTAERYAETVVGHGYDPRKKKQVKIAMLAKTKTCGICETDLSLLPIGSVHLDHCHKTGRIRGLLCFACNNGLGNFKDDTDRLKKAISYLEANK